MKIFNYYKKIATISDVVNKNYISLNGQLYLKCRQHFNNHEIIDVCRQAARLVFKAFIHSNWKM